MYSATSEFKNLSPEFCALMVSTISSEYVLKEIFSGDVEKFLEDNDFIEVIPDHTITLEELSNKLNSNITAYVILENLHPVGILNNIYYDSENYGSMKILKYYLNYKVANNIKYKCIKCGKCCKNGHAVADKEELNRIVENTGLSEKDIIHGRVGDVALLKTKNNNCMFLTENGLCKIKDIFPYNCQITNLSYLFLKCYGMGKTFINCPGIGIADGDLYTLDWVNNEVKTYKEKYGLK